MSVGIGVIIPTKNRPYQTSLAVQSALNQSIDVQEIVIVDDGSDLKSLAELKSLLPHDKRIKLVSLGTGKFHPGIARKRGIEESQSDWIAFLDSDDIWLPRKIELQIEFAVNTGAIAISTNAFQRNPNSVLEKMYFDKIPKKVNLNRLIRRNFIITSSVLVRRSLLEKIAFFATSYSVRSAEDYATWLRCAFFETWNCINEPLVIYNDDYESGVRSDGEVKQNYSDAIGLIDFANWRTGIENTSLQNVMLRRIGLNVFKLGLTK